MGLFFNTRKDVIVTLKQKLQYANEEKICMPSLKILKEPTYFWVASDGTGIQTNKLPASQVLKWETFEAIVKQANILGGRMYRGDVIARSGGRIGEELTDETIEGFVAHICEGANMGDTVLSRSTYFSGILEWAGIVTLHKSQGKGSFITVNAEYKNI